MGAMRKISWLWALGPLLGTACGGVDCADVSEEIAAVSACLSTIFAPGQELRIDVETDWVTEGCARPTCTVQADGGNLFFQIERNACAPIDGDGCQHIEPAIALCEVPPLVPGNYSVRINGEARFGFLRVEDGATDRSCDLHQL